MSGQNLVINVSTGERYQRGQARLISALSGLNQGFLVRTEDSPIWRKHAQVPYAFKAHLLDEIMRANPDVRQVMWCDACILPVRDLQPIWDHAAKHGAWIADNGYSNYEWTADSAYGALFHRELAAFCNVAEWRGETAEQTVKVFMDELRMVNKAIKHVVATAFAVDLDHPNGLALAKEYIRLGTETNAFCGPWVNQNAGMPASPRVAPCGPPDVRGHRHDQTALSVCAWRYNIPLTQCSKFFAYPPTGWISIEPLNGIDDSTILVADGGYV